jgi:hypothetical protein
MLVAEGRKRRSVRLEKEQMLEEKGKGKKCACGRRRGKTKGKKGGGAGQLWDRTPITH